MDKGYINVLNPLSAIAANFRNVYCITICLVLDWLIEERFIGISKKTKISLSDKSIN